MIGGSDGPCSTNVEDDRKADQDDLRPEGKRRTGAVVNGSAKAAAKVTMPRMPVQEMKTAPSMEAWDHVRKGRSAIEG